jgi:hypothetical protein
MFIPNRFLLSLALAALCFRANAAVPPPQKLLPKDTVLIVTAPDWVKAGAFFSNAPYARLWHDPAMKPFADKVMDKFTTTVITPVEQKLGIKFSDYQGLCQGQVTYALLPVTPKDNAESHFANLLLVDARDHADQLKAKLAQSIKKWTDAGKPIKSQKIREVDFTTLILSSDDLALNKVLSTTNPTPTPDETAAKTPPKTFPLTVGQSGSLLLVSDSAEAIDKVLSLQTGGLVPPLEDSPAFQADFAVRLREAPAYAWLNVNALVSPWTKPPAEASTATPSFFRPDKLLKATGLANLTSASFSYQSWPGGTGAQFFIAVPEDKRPALLKIFAAEAKDSAPPSFVPADAVEFSRWRLNVARSYKALEALLTDLFPPEVMTQINALFKMAGKDKDENYDLKAELLDNVGDDIISYKKAPKSATLADLRSPPTLVLLGSPHPDKLAAAVKVFMGLVSQGAVIKDREFLGRKIYSTGAPATADAPASGVSFSASGGYLAFSGDPAILEEFLRSGDSTAKTLMDTPGLADVAQKTGGLATGLFGFENENQAVRPFFDLIHKKSVTVSDLFTPPIPNAAAGAMGPFDFLNQWVDLSLLPPFDAVSKYFYYSVYTGSFSADGFAFKMYMPTPPQLRQ